MVGNSLLHDPGTCPACVRDAQGVVREYCPQYAPRSWLSDRYRRALERIVQEGGQLEAAYARRVLAGGDPDTTPEKAR